MCRVSVVDAHRATRGAWRRDVVRRARVDGDWGIAVGGIGLGTPAVHIALGPEALEKGTEPGRELLVVEGRELVAPPAPKVVGLRRPITETRGGAGLRKRRCAVAGWQSPI